MYENGIGVGIDKEKALNFYERSAKSGSPEGMIFIGLYKQEIDRDFSEALRYYQDAMIAGNPEAYFRIGKFHEEGLIFEQSFEKALEYFRKGEDFNERNSLNSIGFFYEKGIGGLEQSSQKAIQYYEKAASLGDPKALYNLGCIHIDGELVEKNPEKSFDYFLQASDLGSTVLNSHLFRFCPGNDICWGIL
jgi:TPR repeat protein